MRATLSRRGPSNAIVAVVAKTGDAGMDDNKQRIFIAVGDIDAFDRLFNDKYLFETGQLRARYLANEESHARGFLTAAHTLVEEAVKNPMLNNVLMCSILYLYRHSIELHLKWLLPGARKIHDLKHLLRLLDVEFSRYWNVSLTESWAGSLILQFAAIDPGSTSFRYLNNKDGTPTLSEEYMVNLKELSSHMNSLWMFFVMAARCLDEARAGAAP